jgi:predicted RNA binding protein YcfA (HicA-like mRNA interferase family)
MMDGIYSELKTSHLPTSKKTWALTISKNMSKEVPAGTLNQILKAAGLK